MMRKVVTIFITVAMLLTMAVPAFADDAAATAVKKPVKVQELKVLKNGYNSLKLTWAPGDGADWYQVYRSTSGKSGSYVLKKTTTATTYTNTGLVCGKTYYYKIRAVNSAGKGTFSAVKSNKVQPETVKVTKVTVPKDADVRVYWNKISGASGYQMYRKKTIGTTWKLYKNVSSRYNYATDKLVGTDSKGNYINESIYNWEYKVRAYRTVNGKKTYGYFSKAVEWVPDWTIDEIYEELWKYGESLKWTEYEYIEGKNNPELDLELWPTNKKYSLSNITGVYTFNDADYEYVYTNPSKGETKAPAGAKYKEMTPNNSSWYVSWPAVVYKYRTKASILSELKNTIYTDLKGTVKSSPRFWNSDYNIWDGVDAFSIYKEKYHNGYKIYLLY